MATPMETRFELNEAIVENQLVLYYQPIVAVSDRSVVAAEALVRWRHPTRGTLLPAQFVPAIERAGLARELTLWVLREAILQSAVWRQDRQPLPVSVNLSPENLRDAHFRRFLDITLRAVGAPEMLIAELPAATLTTPEQLDSLALMRQKGIRVAIDDVVAPAALGDVPADVVKLGRALVARLGTDPQSRSDAASIVKAAKDQGRSVTAVGIEDERSWKILVDIGCDAAQGFLLAVPMSNYDLALWRERR
ncbi:MAG TPA: EAL domain-containing protein [Candidatus Limnocylindria bacterium]|jgi:EAL domain-containing protein (putative c-di-GMP-specific phosphodiesterase class I)